MNDSPRPPRLLRKEGRVFLQLGKDEPEKPVRLVWARPISGRGKEICILDEKKRAVLMLPGLDALDADSRKIAKEELERGYLIPRITRVISARPRLGHRYWEVETDCGPRRFATRDPRKNVTRITGEHLVIRDVLGNRFEINPFSGLDPESRAQVEMVI